MLRSRCAHSRLMCDHTLHDAAYGTGFSLSKWILDPCLLLCVLQHVPCACTCVPEYALSLGPLEFQHSIREGFHNPREAVARELLTLELHDVLQQGAEHGGMEGSLL